MLETAANTPSTFFFDSPSLRGWEQQLLVIVGALAHREHIRIAQCEDPEWPTLVPLRYSIGARGGLQVIVGNGCPFQPPSKCNCIAQTLDGEDLGDFGAFSDDLAGRTMAARLKVYPSSWYAGCGVFGDTGVSPPQTGSAGADESGR
jgi:hypothetical protein